MGTVAERYSPRPVAANGVITDYGVNSIGGFLCVTSGTLTLTNNSNIRGVAEPVVLFTNLPVTAGVYYPMPFRVNGGFTLTCSSGASGVLGVI